MRREKRTFEIETRIKLEKIARHSDREEKNINKKEKKKETEREFVSLE